MVEFLPAVPPGCQAAVLGPRGAELAALQQPGFFEVRPVPCRAADFWPWSSAFAERQQQRENCFIL